MHDRIDPFSRLFLALAGLLGASGIAAAAMAAHAGDERILGALALVALSHASAVLALALYGGTGKIIRTATVLIGLGALVFCLDLAVRHFTGGRLFPMSAPFGGVAMIAGWLLLALAALFGVRRPAQ
jgi:uncharacterized membrane protein YgdD (TMEM256/DUF423 family)